MNELAAQFIEYLAEGWEELGLERGPKPGPQHESLRGHIPDIIFAVWQEFGFCKLAQGRIWLCDPLAWQDAADAWTETLDLTMDEDRWFPIVRGAFGDMRLWGPRTGMSLWIIPAISEVIPSDNSDQMDSPEDVAIAALMGWDEDKFPLSDATTEKDLFPECLAKLGELKADEMYSFVPVTQLGGQTTAETAVIEKAVPHIMLLRALETAEVRGDIAATQRAREQVMDEWGKGN